MKLSTQCILIPGEVGELEAYLELPDSPRTPLTAAIVCHPHPLYGGNMDNKVVYTLAKTFLNLGVMSLRFNFRGTGRSQGDFAHGAGESQDLLHVAAWLRQHHAPHILWLTGFSFGGYVALCTHQVLQPQRLILVAPPVARCAPEECHLSATPTLIVQGGQDEIVPAQEIERWLHTQAYPAEYRFLEDASHFFHGRLGILRSIVSAWCESARVDSE